MDRCILLLLLLYLINPSFSVFFHISDIHFDPIENPTVYNSTTRCRNPLYYNEHYNPHDTELYPPTEYYYEVGGKYGRYGCDAPCSLVASTILSMSELVADPDFIIMSGDSASHALSFTDQNYSIVELSNYFQKFFPTTSVYFTIGNNDAWPDYTIQCDDPQYGLFLDAWARWIPSNQNSTFLKMGAYSVNQTSSLHIISINTILYSTHHPNASYPVKDPCGQFQWLSDQLSSALEGNQKVYITGHILPGLDSAFFQPLWLQQYGATFINLLIQYEPIIAGLFFGHLHRLVYTDQYSYQVTDIEVYYLDLYTANLNQNPTWLKEYTFTEAYGGSPNNTYSLMNIITALENSTVLFDMWLEYHTSMYLTPKEIYVCLLSTPNLSSFQQCIESKQYTKKRQWGISDND
eukprot:TRINITY_DN1306_c0_g1_i1.p1 TRINITY_DN1306_c0_g1~~TRINITY_DN1306_c0_g1_i1.p1  ORF type:complete len:406 (+),score=54.23 TRINITY_DN1306_c0_g1_i1:111-1328(+)